MAGADRRSYARISGGLARLFEPRWTGAATWGGSSVPLRSTSAPAVSVQGLSVPPPGASRVLVVDDHAVLCHSMAVVLRAEGFDARVAALGPETTAEELLETAARISPRVVLLDLHLDGVIGDALDLIAPLSRGGAAVLVVSGEQEAAQRGACLAAGASGWVNKSDSFPVLVDFVRRAARGETVMPANRRHELVARWREREAERAAALGPFGLLTRREGCVLADLIAGHPAAAIAEASYTSLTTVRSQIRAILTKLGVRSQLEAVALAGRVAWTPACACHGGVGADGVAGVEHGAAAGA